MTLNSVKNWREVRKMLHKRRQYIYSNFAACVVHQISLYN